MQPLQHRGPISIKPREQNVMMRPLRHRDRVQLHKPHLLDDLVHRPGRRVHPRIRQQSLPIHQQQSRPPHTDLRHRSTTCHLRQAGPSPTRCSSSTSHSGMKVWASSFIHAPLPHHRAAESLSPAAPVNRRTIVKRNPPLAPAVAECSFRTAHTGTTPRDQAVSRSGQTGSESSRGPHPHPDTAAPPEPTCSPDRNRGTRSVRSPFAEPCKRPFLTLRADPADPIRNVARQSRALTFPFPHAARTLPHDLRQALHLRSACLHPPPHPP